MLLNLRGGSALALLFVVALSCSRGALAAPINATEYNILTNWISTWQHPLSTNLTGLQTDCPQSGDLGIICDPLGNIKQIFLFSQDNVPDTIYGTIPPQIYNLPSLTGLSLVALKLYGTIPRELLRPQILHLDLGGNFLWGTIPTPPVVPRSTFDYFSLRENFLNGTVPDWLIDAGSMVLSLQKNRLSCPFSYENITRICRFVDADYKCRIDSNKFAGSDGNFCGEAMPYQNGSILPIIMPQPLLITSDAPSPPDYIMDMYPTVLYEITGSTIYIFAKRNNGSIERREYGFINFQGFYEQVSDGSANTYHQAIPINRFNRFIQKSPRVHVAQFDMPLGGSFNLTFNFGPEDFSMPLKLEYSWKNFPFRETTTTMVIVLNIGLKFAHSTPSTQMTCTNPVALSATCSSGLATVVMEPMSYLKEVLFTLKTQLLSFKVQHSVEYVADGGAPVRFGSLAPRVTLSPYGPEMIMHDEVYSAPGSPFPDELRRGYELDPELKMQSLAYTVQFEAKRFSNSLFVDPTISMDLLFDPSIGSPSSGAEISIAGAVIGSIAGVAVLAAILVVVLVPSVRYKVMPFLKKTETLPERSHLTVEADLSPPTSPASGSSNPRNSTWKSGRVTSN